MSHVKVIEAAAMRLSEVNSKIIALGAERERALADLEKACRSANRSGPTRAQRTERRAVGRPKGRKRGIVRRAVEYLKGHNPISARDISAVLNLHKTLVYTIFRTYIKRGEVQKYRGEDGVMFRWVAQSKSSQSVAEPTATAEEAAQA